VPEHAERIRRTQAALASAGVDGLVVTNLVNVRYLTGFDGSNGVLCLTATEARFMTDFRYAERAAPIRAFADVDVAVRDLIRELGSGLAAHLPGAGRIGFEAASLPYALWQDLSGGVPAGAELVPTSGVVETLRRVKSAAELEAIAAACAPLDDVYASLASDGLVGRTEAEVAWWIERTLREAGFGLSFEGIVAAGEHGARPHHEPSDRAIARGDLVVVDIGARLDGYCSDCTRTFGAGGLVSERAKEDYAIVLEAQQAALAAIRPGASGHDVDAVARDLIAKAGRGDRFGHGLGHGVGLEVHEGPTLREPSTDVLEAGNVVSDEPGIYEPGSHGVRIEDLVAVTEDGPRVLTGFTKELVETA
jgi:Xaa-Pro aminopeptidase